MPLKKWADKKNYFYFAGHHLLKNMIPHKENQTINGTYNCIMISLNGALLLSFSKTI